MRLKINLANKNGLKNATEKLQAIIDSRVEYQNAMIRSIADRLLNTMKLNASKYEGLNGSYAQESLRIEEFSMGNGLIGCRIIGEDYILYIEYGTGIYAEGGNGRQTPWAYFNDNLNEWRTTIGMMPRPFIRTAIEEVRETIDKEVEVFIGEWIASK